MNNGVIFFEMGLWDQVVVPSEDAIAMFRGLWGTHPNYTEYNDKWHSGKVLMVTFDGPNGYCQAYLTDTLLELTIHRTKEDKEVKKKFSVDLFNPNSLNEIIKWTEMR